MKNKNFLVLLSHLNYKVYSSGTEKFIRDLEGSLNKGNISLMHIFSIQKFPNKIGVNLDGKFYGIYDIKDLSNLVNYQIKCGYICEGISLHHLLGYNLDFLAHELISLNIKISIFIHDFYLAFDNYHTSDYLDHFADISFNDKEMIEKHNKQVNNFFHILDFLISKVIFPSEFCEEKFLLTYPQLKDRSFLRPHLKCIGTYKKGLTNDKIRIAYVGKKNDAKGYFAWKYLIDNKLYDNYDLYYFGSDIDSSNINVTEVNVTNFNNKNEMFDSLRKNNIDVVILWSQVAETFSYTYYESSAAGCVIVTNRDSGNIAKQCEINKNGIVLDNNESSLLQFFKEDIHQFPVGKESSFSPDELIVNDEIDFFITDNVSQIKIHHFNIHRNYLLSFIYKLKYRV